MPLSPFKNLITRTALYVLRAHGIKSLPPNLHVAVDNGVPFGRGLGSSGAAVIAGVLLGSLLGDLDLPLSRLLDFALMVERHPDNVSAALVGGFVGSYLRELSPLETSAAEVPLAEVLPEYPADAGPDWGLDPPIPPRGIGHFVRFGWAKEIKAIAIVPRFELSTAKARGVLPEAYTRKDMVRIPALAPERTLRAAHAERTLGFLPDPRSARLPRPPGVQPPAAGCPDDRPRPVAARRRPHLRGDEGPDSPALPQRARTCRPLSFRGAAQRWPRASARPAIALRLSRLFRG